MKINIYIYINEIGKRSKLLIMIFNNDYNFKL